MGFNFTAAPTQWVTVTTGKRCHLFHVGDTLTFTFSKTGSTAYTVRNYWGTVVASGTPSGTTLTLPALNPGWYRLYLTGPISDATFGTAYGQLTFSVILNDSNLLTNPADGTVGSYEPPLYVGKDHVMRGVAVIGPHRSVVQTAASPAADIASVQADLVFQKNYWSASAKTDAARPRENFMMFPNGTVGAGEPAGVTTTVAALYPDVKWFEGPRNEPQGTAAASVATEQQTFYNAVKAGNASAKVLGPAPVSINLGHISWIDAFLTAGGGAYMDGFSFHPYNSFNGDVALARRSMGALMATLAAHGLSALPLWSTESNSYFAARDGVLAPRHHARRSMFETLMSDQYGITKERTYTFYDTSHGFWAFPSWWKNEDGSVFPWIPMMRVFSGEVFGKTYTSAFAFPEPKEDWCVGNLYTNGTTGAKVAVFISAGRTDESVTFALTGAASVTTVDCFGNTATLTADARGEIAVPITEVPVYVRLPAGVSIAVTDRGFGHSVVQWGATCTPTALKELGGLAVSGLRKNYYDQIIGGASHFVDSTATLPFTFIVDLANPQVIDCVTVECPEPWQVDSTFLDFDVDTWNGSTWTTQATITEPTPTVSFVSISQSGASRVESFFSDRCIFVATFAAVTTSRFRVVVRATTYGGEPTAAAKAAGGLGDSVQRVHVREIKAYRRTTATTNPFVVEAS